LALLSALLESLLFIVLLLTDYRPGWKGRRDSAHSGESSQNCNMLRESASFPLLHLQRLGQSLPRPWVNAPH
jgi:hypothetical protein